MSGVLMIAKKCVIWLLLGCSLSSSAFAFLFVLVPGSVEATQATGIYSFMNAKYTRMTNQIPPSVELSYVDGIFAWVRWKHIEYADDVYAWRIIDDLVDVAKQEGKSVKLGFFAGEGCPEFVLTNSVTFSGIRVYPEDRGITNAVAMTFPVYWDSYYTNKWYEFISAVADRYATNSTVTGLQISGPGPTAMEMSLRLDESEWDRFRAIGYSEANYIQAWEKTIDHCVTVWPKELGIHLGLVIPDTGTNETDAVWQSISQYCISNYPSQIVLKVAFLNGSWWHNQGSSAPAKPLIDQMKVWGQDPTVRTGGEMFWSSYDLDEAVNGPLGKALQNGIDWNFDEIEVYQTDIADYDSLALVEQYIPDLIYGHNAMLGDRQRGEFGYFQNVGHFGEEGSVVFSNNTYTCDGAGFRLWGTSDQFQYTYRLVANDTEIGGQVLSVENVSDDAKAGLMLREYPSSEACYIAALFRPGGVLQIQARTVSGGETQTLATKSDGWRWVMLQRDGDIFKAFYRKDSFASWVNLCGTNIAMRNVICSGLAVSSRDNDVGCSTVYTNIWTLDDF